MTDFPQISREITILMVDDMLSNLAALSDILATFGYHVQQTRDGKSALEAVALDPPDLILLDINMPEMNGYEVCR